MYTCSTVLKKRTPLPKVMYFCRYTILLLVILLASLVFADLIIEFLGDTSLILQQIQLILNFYM